ncbi:MAG: type II secretion system GspH family protein [Deltaproteobacteria bacterium]|nr:type II secretion system GspH family protein [Deltaproteobacteria bacterium]MDA8308300.1 type II secretion system protein [Deltaproteobacteria bacterium]
MTKNNSKYKALDEDTRSVPCPATCHLRLSTSKGFTLLEVLVSLAIAALLIGSVMGLISEALRYRTSLKEKTSVQPILESAAEIILADPEKAMQGVVRLTELQGDPAVAVSLTPEPLYNPTGKNQKGTLCRVMLNYKASNLEFSIIVPVGKGS